jgi:hypothetical protein
VLGGNRIHIGRATAVAVVVMTALAGYRYFTAPMPEVPAVLRPPPVPELDEAAHDRFEAVAWLYESAVIAGEDVERADAEGSVDVEELNRLMDTIQNSPGAAQTREGVSAWTPPEIVVRVDEDLRLGHEFALTCLPSEECRANEFFRALTGQLVYGARHSAQGFGEDASESLAAGLRMLDAMRIRATSALEVMVAAVSLLRVAGVLDCMARWSDGTNASMLSELVDTVRAVADAQWSLADPLRHDWAYYRQALVVVDTRWWRQPGRRRFVSTLDDYHVEMLAALEGTGSAPEPPEPYEALAYIDPRGYEIALGTPIDYAGRDRRLRAALTRARHTLDSIEARARVQP